MTQTHRHPVEIDGQRLNVANLEKVLYPQTGFTKGEMIEYYLRVADVMLPHLRGRPVAFKRYPDGVDGAGFLEKACAARRPDFVRSEKVTYGPRGRTVNHCLVENRAALVWAANLATIEFHAGLARAPDFDHPTMVVFDLDPAAPAHLLDCAAVAQRLHGMLEQLGLASYAKTSGLRGMHVVVPINGPSDYGRGRAFAQAAAATLEHDAPDLVTADITADVRKGRVLIDWSQNAPQKTMACAYSLRAEARPTVSTPVSWEEIARAVGRGDPSLLVFGHDEVLDRVANLGDLFAPVQTMLQQLPEGV